MNAFNRDKKCCIERLKIVILSRITWIFTALNESFEVIMRRLVLTFQNCIQEDDHSYKTRGCVKG